MTPRRILVVGDMILDRYLFGTVDRISPEAPVPVLLKTRIEDRAGGAANVAANMAKLGADVTLAGMVGKDEAGESLMRLLDDAGVTTEGVMALAKHETTVKMRPVTIRHQHMLRIDFESMPHAGYVEVFTRKLVVPIARHFDIIVLSDYGKGTLALCQEIIAVAPSTSRVLIDTKGTDWTKYSGAWLIKPNEAEFASAVGAWADRAEMVAKAETLIERLSVENILITMGERGMVLVSRGSCTSFPSEARDVYDVCGAGDTVLATLAVMLANGMDLVDAVRSANSAAGIVVGKFGTASVTVDELEQE